MTREPRVAGVAEVEVTRCWTCGHAASDDDRLAAAEAKVARCEAILAAWEAWDGSPGPDGRMHPDSSSPHDRSQLRAALSEADQ